MMCLTLWTKFKYNHSKIAKVRLCQSFILFISTTQKTRKNADIRFFHIDSSSKKIISKPVTINNYFIF